MYNCIFYLQAVFSLGVAIFKALDFGSNEEEEILLSPDLEALITFMTSCSKGEEFLLSYSFRDTQTELQIRFCLI